MRIKVISFNIRCVDDKNGNSIHERAPRLSTVTAPYDADVIGFQEYTPAWEHFINEYFCDKYEFFNKYRTDTGWIESAPILCIYEYSFRFWRAKSGKKRTLNP